MRSIIVLPFSKQSKNLERKKHSSRKCCRWKLENYEIVCWCVCVCVFRCTYRYLICIRCKRFTQHAWTCDSVPTTHALFSGITLNFSNGCHKKVMNKIHRTHVHSICVRVHPNDKPGRRLPRYCIVCVRYEDSATAINRNGGFLYPGHRS